MDDEVLLTMLLNGLELSLDYMDTEAKESKRTELLQYIHSAQNMIEREGIVLTTDIDDYLLVSMYCIWLYDKRKTTGSKYTSYYIQNMPRMLRYNLNNRLFAQKAKDNA